MNHAGRLAETLLMHAYGGPPVRVEGCVCGGWIGAATGQEREAVAAHNDSELHAAWRAYRALLDEASSFDVEVVPPTEPLSWSSDPTAEPDIRDVSGWGVRASGRVAAGGAG